MSRTPIAVDRDELEAAIQVVEENGPLSSLASLHSAVAQIMGGNITPILVRSRILEWKINVKTQPGRKAGRPTATPVAAKDADNTPSPGQRLRMICVPAGRCPYQLSSIDYETVIKWAEKVRNHGMEHGVHYLPEALIYFTRQFTDIVDVNENSYRIVKSHILEWASAS